MSRLITITLGAAMAVAAAAAPAAAEDLQALLARPMTPGSVALLVEHVMEPAVQKRLIEAVKHEDPAVRAVAARIAFVTTSRGLAAPLDRHGREGGEYPYRRRADSRAHGHAGRARR